jgi:hypothetical protein
MKFLDWLNNRIAEDRGAALDPSGVDGDDFTNDAGNDGTKRCSQMAYTDHNQVALNGEDLPPTPERGMQMKKKCRCKSKKI